MQAVTFRARVAAPVGLTARVARAHTAKAFAAPKTKVASKRPVVLVRAAEARVRLGAGARLGEKPVAVLVGALAKLRKRAKNAVYGRTDCCLLELGAGHAVVVVLLRDGPGAGLREGAVPVVVGARGVFAVLADDAVDGREASKALPAAVAHLLDGGIVTVVAHDVGGRWGLRASALDALWLLVTLPARGGACDALAGVYVFVLLDRPCTGGGSAAAKAKAAAARHKGLGKCRREVTSACNQREGSEEGYACKYE